MTTEGRSAKKAYQFVCNMLDDVCDLIITLDRKMEKESWSIPVQEISSKTTNKVQSEGEWIIDGIYRLYKHKQKKWIFAINIIFTPKSDEPVCLALCALFAGLNDSEAPSTEDGGLDRATNLKTKDIWDKWESSEKVVEFLQDKKQPERIPKDLLTQDGPDYAFMPDAQDAFAKVVPLYDMKDSQTLFADLIDPILEKCNEWEGPSPHA